MNTLWLKRRAFLGTLFAGVIAPSLVEAQANSSSDTKDASMKISITFNGQVITATLDNSPSAQDLASMVPLELTFEDYSTNEKIAYLPRKLTQKGGGAFQNEAPGDLCYYAPWGNLVFYHGSYHYSDGLIRLGRLDGGIEPLLTKGKFPLRIEQSH
jgi:hypothetical protein